MKVFVIIACIYALIWAVTGIGCYALFKSDSRDPSNRDVASMPSWLTAAFIGMLWPLLVMQFAWLLYVGFSEYRSDRKNQSGDGSSGI